MSRLRWVSVPLLLAMLPSLAEWIPPPTIDDLLRADCAVVGHFSDKDGAVRFVPAQALWGDVGIVEKLQKEGEFEINVEEDGRLTVWTWGSADGVISDGGYCSADARRQTIWLFFKGCVAAQPVELTEGLMALRRREEPPAIFRLLQRLDFDMRRDAMERLFAERDKELIARLHRIALAQESLACFNAIDVLIETHLLDADRFWDGWIDHPYGLQELLQARDPGRVARDLRKAIEVETRPIRLTDLLYQAREDVDVNIRHVDHAAEEVRDRALGNLYGSLLELARQPRQASQLKALSQRVLPLLVARRKVETSERILHLLDRMLDAQDGVPGVLRVPASIEPPARYLETEERKFVVGRLTSGGHGFAAESAGREIAAHFLEDGFERLKVAADSGDYNTKQVYDGMGYLRHPSVFAHLVEHAKASSDDATLRAIGRQNQERSFEVLKEIIESRFGTAGASEWAGAFDALGLVRDKRALDLLKNLRHAVDLGSALQYVRARAAHDDPWAIQELLTALGEPSSCELPLMDANDRDDVIGALLVVDAPEATEAIERHVRLTWPSRCESFDSFDSLTNMGWCLRMENNAGGFRRTTALGEVARRDPRWLAELALERMGSPSLTARVCGAHAFRYLTGRSFGFRPEAFAAERAPSLRALGDWWAAHKGETREEWLLSCFMEKGFPMLRLDDKSSLPVLVKALAADSFTHDLAVERISIITGKYFTQPRLQCGGGRYYIGGGGYAQVDQARTTARVTGWLEARKLLPATR